ncbi:hypothetical protein [[Clostridium] scindens]|uniref:hypothetical protein n=2 Tax=Clostridium scindens (strain JCM 10418 / VPI 12708) TaxID=29347 RepID=UPI0015706C7A|nr:hypothetical protein [[Clostridium] scindens]NSI89023.1 hypothetical protein [[Clostridium] scindens]NSJ03251.1 hypothetical protein [[Clostridium] scindens]
MWQKGYSMIPACVLGGADDQRILIHSHDGNETDRGKSAVVLSAIVTVVLNQVLPKEQEEAAE